MPRVMSYGSERFAAAEPSALLEFGAGTGMPALLKEDVYETLYGRPLHTGHWECYLHGATYEEPGVSGEPELFWLRDGNWRTFVVALEDQSTKQAVTRVTGVGGLRAILGLPVKVGLDEGGLSRRLNVGYLANGLNAKLNQRLEQFREGRVGEQVVTEETLSSVTRLLAWLCSKSTAVSATVSGAGMLSIATEFPNETRLYVEVERDGTVGAAVTRERRYARDLDENTLAGLTPEVILAAVNSV